MRALLGVGSSLLVGADLMKDVNEMLRAYDDSKGVTARFNLNLLCRINNQLGANFNLEEFEHAAIWNSDFSRIEMHLISKKQQIVRVAGRVFEFNAGETIHTESAHKYTPQGFSDLANLAGWSVAGHWLSEKPEFGFFHLQC